MTQRHFIDDRDFHQAALAYTAFAIYETACDCLSDGVKADVSESALFHLLDVAKAKKSDLGTLSTIGMYANLVQDENERATSR